MCCLNFGFYLFSIALTVHSLPQSQTADISDFGNFITSEITDVIGPNENEFSHDIDYTPVSTYADNCITFADDVDHSLSRRDDSLYKKIDASGMCPAKVIHSSAEHNGKHDGFNVSPLDGRQGATNARAKKDFNICPQHFFPGRPMPVCPSPLGGEIITMADGTLSLQYATSMLLIFDHFVLDS